MFKRFVYVLRNDESPPRYYTGVTSNVPRRLAKHNAGACIHTATHRPWIIDIVIEFADERRAVAFERYLKSGSGVASLVLPSVNSHEFPGVFGLPPYAIEASLGIGGIDAEGREHGFSGTVLRGSPTHSGTTESLAPGESLIIRFPGWIIGVDGPSAPATGKAKLFASFLLRDNECRDWQPVTSRPVDIWLRGRE